MEGQGAWFREPRHARGKHGGLAEGTYAVADEGESRAWRTDRNDAEGANGAVARSDPER